MEKYQRWFDQVYPHLIKQNARSANHDVVNGICMYRGANGMKCAIGWLIPDDLYDPVIENKPVGRLLKWDDRIAKAIDCDTSNEHEIAFLRRLQEIHDTLKPYQWKDEFAELAKEYRLTVPCLDS